MADRQLVVIAANFTFSFPAKMLAHISNNIKLGEHITQYATNGDIKGLEQQCYQRVLNTKGPVVLIGICIQPDTHIMADFKQAKIPVILIDETAEGASTITTNNFLGGYLATEHLIHKGYRNIAIISGRTDVQGGYNSIKRLEGARQAYYDNGLIFNKNYIIEVQDYSYVDGLKTMQEIIQDNKHVDAIFCAAGDDSAAGILRAAREHGLSVPKDLAIVGYDDTEVAQILSPSLTTIKQPLKEMAETAYKIAVTENLDELINNRRNVAFEPELIIREST
ncbi:MAG: substrate-binding domain-containing protein [Deltaproteobacteria bacterium]|nr:substrate-binding domain-containing protein [Deltaproteobacteria bacterium]